MPGGRRGLVAPQNTFLENIIRRSNSQRKYIFFCVFVILYFINEQSTNCTTASIHSNAKLLGTIYMDTLRPTLLPSVSELLISTN